MSAAFGPRRAATARATGRATAGSAALLLLGWWLVSPPGPLEPDATPSHARLRLNPNTAAPAELALLPEVADILAGRIAAHRAAHGPFRSLADLDAVPGIGPATLDKISPWLTFDPPPASEAATRVSP